MNVAQKFGGDSKKFRPPTCFGTIFHIKLWWSPNSLGESSTKTIKNHCDCAVSTLFGIHPFAIGHELKTQEVGSQLSEEGILIFAAIVCAGHRDDLQRTGVAVVFRPRMRRDTGLVKQLKVMLLPPCYGVNRDSNQAVMWPMGN